MPNLNRVLLIGNLTRDPEVRYTPKGTAVTDISIAINRVIGGGEEGSERREEVTYVDVTLWGRQAEVAQQYLTKGRGVFIEGRLQLDTWDDKQTGQKRSRLKVVGENMQMLSGRGSANAPTEGEHGEQPVGNGASGNPAPSRRPAPAPRPQPARDPDLDAESDDIPF